jgi:LPS export ABC transporter protein LptC
MIFRILAILFFVVIVGGSIWLGGAQREATSTTTLEASNVDLGYSARDATLIETGTDGLPMYTLQADVIRQHPGDGVDFEPVQLTFRDADGQIWKGRADHGELTTETGKVVLNGNVHVDGILPGSDQLSDLATELLFVDTHESIINTDEPVSVTSIGRSLKSRGMVATLKDHHLVLESNVRANYTP